jgi:prevent-host-death family protein
MREAAVGVRELRTRLSAHLKRLKQGETILVTEHGRAVARLTSAGATLEERLQELVAAGIVGWSGKKVHAPRPRVRTKRGGSLAELIAGDRV